MILLIFLATILIISVTIYQYDEQTKEYNVSRFGRKEETLKKETAIQLYQRSTVAVTTENLQTIFHKANLQLCRLSISYLEDRFHIFYRRMLKLVFC